MVAMLSWDERVPFENLLGQLEQLQKIDWSVDYCLDEARMYFTNMSWSYELLVPGSSEHFKACSVGAAAQ